MIKKITENFTPKEYLVEFCFALTALLGFYLIIAWSSYSPFDSAWSVSGFQSEVLNKAGKFGAWVIDLLFVLFGQVGNLIPFVLLITPIYFIRSRRTHGLTAMRFCVRLIGFSLLLCGLTVLCALLFDDSNYHLSGGVLGASLVKSLQPSIDIVGVIVFGIITFVFGFIFCSGASLIFLLIRFYHWVTLKNEENHDESASEIETATENLTQNIQADETTNLASRSDIPLEQGETGLIAPNVMTLETEHNTELQGIKITGLNTEQATAIPNDENQFSGFALEQDELPQVKITPTPDFLQPNEPAVILQESENTVIEQSAIPTVKLVLPEVDEKRAIEKTAENLTALSAASASVSNTKQGRQEAEIEKEVAKSAPSYKPYENSLIHPLLQPKTNNVKKPTTPLPALDLLDRRPVAAQDITRAELLETSKRIEQQLRNFNIKAKVMDVLVGPVVTRYELELEAGVKASKVTNIDKDLARALMLSSIRVADVVPGKPYIGIETPNDRRQTVSLRDVLESNEFRQSKAILPMALGKDISGKAVVIDLAKTPHLLVAGSTGSGKSVGINPMILSLLYRVTPEQVKFIMIDPKVVELSIYNGIPHLLTEVVTDMKKAANALRWCVDEMERRYQLLSYLRVRNIEGYNEKIDEAAAMNLPIPDPTWKPGDSMDTMPPALEKLSYIVLIVDEFADLMMVAGKQIEELIARLTQKARAIGIHVILATQRPSVDVITGLIKSNIPSRIAFTVVQRNDSRTILDQNGAEALLGKGDMLYLGNGTTDLIRVHGAFMSDDEVVRVADDWRARGKPNYISSILESVDDENDDDDFVSNGGSDELDPLFDRAVEIVVNTGTTSTSFIQRRLKIGFNRAANIMEQMEEQGIVSEMRNGKRELLSRNPNTDY